MATAAAAIVSVPQPAASTRVPMRWAIAGVIAVGVAARIAPGIGVPLWFDETFSAVIASQPTPAALIDWCRAEIGGSAYYMLLWLWAQLFGTGATALRSLSFAASVAAPALVAWRGHPDRATRLLWAALMALWLPALVPATDARPYALAMLATTVQAIAFHRLMTVPGGARAFAWTGASAMAVLTHVHCAAIALAGGAIFVVIHRRRALACWPALAPLIPMAIWLGVQFPALAAFGAHGAWYPPFDALDLALAPASLFDSLVLGMVLTAGPLVTLAKGWRAEHAMPDRALAASGLLALAAVIALAAVRPSFTWRYAIPFGPAILFAVAIWARGLGARFAAAPALLVALFAVSATARTIQVTTHPGEDERTRFTLALPSDWLASHGAKHLAFLWAGPTGTMSDPRRIDEVAGYFLRQRWPLSVSVLHASAAVPASPVVAAALRRDPTIDSLIWLADRSVPGTGAIPDRRMMARLGWTCRDYAHDPVVMLTCRRPDR